LSRLEDFVRTRLVGGSDLPLGGNGWDLTEDLHNLDERLKRIEDHFAIDHAVVT
jgi:hypothetical protein